MGILLLLWLLDTCGFVGMVIFLVKRADQRRIDNSRISYRLNFPHGLHEDQVLAFLRDISGTLRPKWRNLLGVPSVAFEIYATNHVITHRLRIPAGYEDYILSHLRLIGVNAERDYDFVYPKWKYAAEMGMKNSSRTLRIFNRTDTSNSLLANFQALDQSQGLFMQWVVSPSAPVKLPIANQAQTHHPNPMMVVNGSQASNDEVNDRRKKLEEPGYLAVLRVAAVAEDKAGAQRLVQRIKSSLGAIRGAEVRFEKRLASQATLRERIEVGSGAIVFPGQLSAGELTGLLGWKIGNPLISGLAQTMTRPMPAPATVPTDGRRLGRSTMYGQERTIAMSYQHAVKHFYCVGPPGVGKTTLLRNTAAQDMQNGYGVIVIEAKKDLFLQALEVVPTHRLDDVIILDFDDKDYPLGFNILDQGNSRTMIDEISMVISKMYAGGSQSITAPRIIYHALHALAEYPGSTFVDLPDLLKNAANADETSDWQRAVADYATDPDVKSWIQNYMNMTRRDRDQESAPVYNRTWEFTNRPEIKRVFGQRTSSFKMTDVIAGNKILLVNLNGANVGGVTASIAGTLLVNSVWQAVRAVQAPKPNFMYLDEFQSFTNLAVDMEDMLAKSRSSNLGMVLAHQYISQLDPVRRTAVVANTGTKFAFETTADDARLLAKEFSGRQKIADTDFMSLARHEGIALIATDEGKSPPVTVLTSGPTPATGNAQRAIYMSRQKYGRPIASVMAALTQRELTARPRANRRNRPAPGTM